MENIWDKNCFNVFLSYNSEEAKDHAINLRNRLRLFGISCFVANRDIYPTHNWQEVIKKTLYQMDGFIALLTDNYHRSVWTNQEVGFAICRNVPIITVTKNTVPEGFLYNFQSVIKDSVKEESKQIAQCFIKNNKMIDQYVTSVENCSGYDDGNDLSSLLSSIEKLSEVQKDRLMFAFNNNNQVSNSHGFEGGKIKYNNGKSLVDELNRLSFDSQFHYKFSHNNKIVKLSKTYY